MSLPPSCTVLRALNPAVVTILLDNYLFNTQAHDTSLFQNTDTSYIRHNTIILFIRGIKQSSYHFINSFPPPLASSFGSRGATRECAVSTPVTVFRQQSSTHQGGLYAFLYMPLFPHCVCDPMYNPFFFSDSLKRLPDAWQSHPIIIICLNMFHYYCYLLL